MSESERARGGEGRGGLRGFLMRWLTAATLAFVVLVTVRGVVVDAFRIPTSSMERTLLAGDFLLVNKAAYGARVPGTEVRLPAGRAPDRGDVIVFHPPHSPSKHYVKRVVGLSGDTVEMRDKQVFINGIALDEPYVQSSRRRDGTHPSMRWQNDFGTARAPARPTRDNWGPLWVPEGRYLVLGDNRDNSEDSRYWGFVEEGRILGKPWLVYYSRTTKADPDRWVEQVRWDRIGGLVE